MNALELTSISKSFGSQRALDTIHLSIAPGSRTAIVGPSGSGKTTLLRMIAGFEQPDAGRIVLGDQVLVDQHTHIPAYQRNIGYVPQDGALFPHLTVAANIGFGLDGSASSKQPRVAELLAMVQLDETMGKRWPHELSGGQQQRVALARALAQRPRLMLLDEPFSALDTGLRTSMRKLVMRLLTDAEVTTILVTHDQAEALSFAHQLAVMRRGRLVQAGAPRDLYLQPHDEETALFLGDAVVMPAWIENGRADCELGDIPVHPTTTAGAARIMLRPEQLRVCAGESGQTGLPGCYGVVTERDFAGNTCTLTVKLATNNPVAHGSQMPRSLLVRSNAIEALEPGSSVRISTHGLAHAFA